MKKELFKKAIAVLLCIGMVLGMSNVSAGAPPSGPDVSYDTLKAIVRARVETLTLGGSGVDAIIAGINSTVTKTVTDAVKSIATPDSLKSIAIPLISTAIKTAIAGYGVELPSDIDIDDLVSDILENQIVDTILSSDIVTEILERTIEYAVADILKGIIIPTSAEVIALQKEELTLKLTDQLFAAPTIKVGDEQVKIIGILVVPGQLYTYNLDTWYTVLGAKIPKTITITGWNESNINDYVDKKALLISLGEIKPPDLSTIDYQQVVLASLEKAAKEVINEKIEEAKVTIKAAVEKAIDDIIKEAKMEVIKKANEAFAEMGLSVVITENDTEDTIKSKINNALKDLSYEVLQMHMHKLAILKEEIKYKYIPMLNTMMGCIVDTIRSIKPVMGVNHQITMTGDITIKIPVINESSIDVSYTSVGEYSLEYLDMSQTPFTLRWTDWVEDTGKKVIMTSDADDLDGVSWDATLNKITVQPDAEEGTFNVTAVYNPIGCENEITKVLTVSVQYGDNADQAEPTETLEGIPPTNYGISDGKITGTTAAMEYKLSSDTNYIAATETEIAGLAAGTYNVRYKAKPRYNAGTPKDVIVPEYVAPKSDIPAPKDVIVIVNGEEQNAGSETESYEGDNLVITVDVNEEIIDEKINDILEKLENDPTLERDNIIEVPATQNDGDKLVVSLTGDIVKKMEDNDFTLSVKKQDIEYIIPAKEITIQELADDLGVAAEDLKDIEVEVRITNIDDPALIARMDQIAKDNGDAILFPPVEFEVFATTTDASGNKTEVEVSTFSNYVERVMEIPAGVDPNKVTTGIVFNADGSYESVPTVVFQKDGKWYARLSSLTNSAYSIVYNPVTIESVNEHWSKIAVNDMASRLIISNAELFRPDAKITRAIFAEYLTKGLGLFRTGSEKDGQFKDVSVSTAYANAITIAKNYGIIIGYPDGTFRSSALITREEAIVMCQRAMIIVKLASKDSDKYLDYADFTSISSWALASAKAAVSVGVFNGTSDSMLSPKANLTYAEAATAIRNLLIIAGLINE